jgi:hypothetical protein
MMEKELLEAVRTQIRNYHMALDLRTIASAAAMSEAITGLQRVLDMPYVQGQELARRQREVPVDPRERKFVAKT